MWSLFKISPQFSQKDGPPGWNKPPDFLCDPEIFTPRCWGLNAVFPGSPLPLKGPPVGVTPRTVLRLLPKGPWKIPEDRFPSGGFLNYLLNNPWNPPAKGHSSLRRNGNYFHQFEMFENRWAKYKRTARSSKLKPASFRKAFVNAYNPFRLKQGLPIFVLCVRSWRF